MKRLFFLPLAAFSLLWCTNSTKGVTKHSDTRVVLRADTLNVVKLTDTLLINESTCRGCVFQETTHFAIVDSMGLIKLLDVITEDRNSPEVNGGSVYKGVLLKPQKTGTTTFKLYKFWKQETAAEDSANFISYRVTIKN
jgi:hypothetical protein